MIDLHHLRSHRSNELNRMNRRLAELPPVDFAMGPPPPVICWSRFWCEAFSASLPGTPWAWLFPGAALGTLPGVLSGDGPEIFPEALWPVPRAIGSCCWSGSRSGYRDANNRLTKQSICQEITEEVDLLYPSKFIVKFWFIKKLVEKVRRLSRLIKIQLCII